MIHPTLQAEQAEAFSHGFNRLLDNIETVVRGKRDRVAMALVSLFAEGHLLVEDVPGTGKTVLAKTLAASIGGSASRIQFTPDLLPSDVTGGLMFNQAEGSFHVHRGPVFANVVVADEINRASPKTQSALLQVMEEREVTIGTETHPVPRPFVVLATQNPVEQVGTYRLPEAQLDRFGMRMSLGHPDEEAEVEVLRLAGSAPTEVAPVLSLDHVRRMVTIAATVQANDEINRYIVRLAAATREIPSLRIGLSTRGALALLRSARSLAASQARCYVTADDVKAVAPFVVPHRLLLTPEAELAGVDPAEMVHDLLTRIEIPRRARA
jgi:MoxR-like ATPase